MAINVKVNKRELFCLKPHLYNLRCQVKQNK